MANKKYMEMLEKYSSQNVLKKYGSSLEDLLKTEEVTSFGVPSMDIISGIGGVMDGGHIEVYGKWSSGKSTLSYYFLAQRQRKIKNRLHVILNFEGNRKVEYIQKCGVLVDPSSLMLVTPRSLEDGFQLCVDMMNDHVLATVIVDSLAAGAEFSAVNPSQGKDGAKVGKTKVGSHSSSVGLIFRQITALAWREKATFWWNNQIRSLVGVMFGPSETTSGGNAPKFYSYARLDLQVAGLLRPAGDKKFTTVTGEEAKQTAGIRVRATFTKNKFGTLLNQCCYDIYAGAGIDVLQNRIDILVAKGVFTKNSKGSWYPDPSLLPITTFTPFKSMTALREYFYENMPILSQVEDLFKDKEVKGLGSSDNAPIEMFEGNWDESDEASEIKRVLEEMKEGSQAESLSSVPLPLEPVDEN